MNHKAKRAAPPAAIAAFGLAGLLVGYLLMHSPVLSGGQDITNIAAVIGAVTGLALVGVTVYLAAARRRFLSLNGFVILGTYIGIGIVFVLAGVYIAITIVEYLLSTLPF